MNTINNRYAGMDMFHDWTPRELDALSRPTSLLRAMQDTTELPTLKGCHFSKKQGSYVIRVYVDGQQIHAGSMKRWDEAAALAMQYEAEQKYWAIKNKTKS